MGSWGWLLPLENWLAESVNDSSLVDVVRRHLKLHAIASGEANEALAHFARDVGEDGVVVSQLHPEHGPGEDGSNFPLEFDSFFRIHIYCKTGAPF